MTTGIERLKLMREKLAESAAGGGGGSSRDPSIYPFWNIKVGESCVLRFLPDKDENNPYPWVEKILFKWNFPDPRQPQRPVTVTMPCREMYDGPKTCPVMNELRPLWKSDEETAKRFWPKRSYVYSGFVRKSSWQENPAPENPIRKFFINKKMHGFIKETLLSTNEETMFQCSPDDFENGTNFVVKKTKDGQWDSYATSQWANQSSCLTNDEIAAIEKYGLIDLKTAFPQRPSDEAFAIQMTMLHAAMDGKEWDPAWDVHFKAYGKDAARGDADDADDSPPMPVAKASPAATSAALQRIRGSQAQPAQTTQSKPEHDDEAAESSVDSQKAKVEKVSGQPADVLSRLRAMKNRTQN
jgi:hypothetical protein